MGKPSEDHLPGWQKETDRNHIDPPRRTRTVLCNRSRNRKAACQDLLKREVRTATIRFDGKELKTDKVYDTKTGLLVRESLPDKESTPALWNRYAYDRYARRYRSAKPHKPILQKIFIQTQAQMSCSIHWSQRAAN